MSRLTARALETQEEIDEARILLHEVYMDEMKWTPDPKNPSKLRTEFLKNQSLLVDAFDSISFWIGIFDGNKLIATHRHSPKLDGKIELEHYREMPEFLLTGKSIEMNRLAIHRDYRKNSPAFLMIVAADYEFLGGKLYDFAFSTAEFPNPGEMYCKVGMKRADINPFKYSDADPNEVSLIYFDFRNREEMDRYISIATRVIKRFK